MVLAGVSSSKADEASPEELPMIDGH